MGRVHVVLVDGENGAEVLGVFGSRALAESEAIRLAKRDGFIMGPIPLFEFGTHLKDHNGRDTEISVWTMPMTRRRG